MDVEPALVADREATKASEPSKGALNNPSVLAQPLAALDATARDAVLDATPEAGASATAVVVGLVGMQLVRAAPRVAALAGHEWESVEQFLERLAVVGVGPGQQKGERDAATVGDEVALGACLTPVRRVRARSGSPLFAAMDALSMQARLQLILFAACRRVLSAFAPERPGLAG